MSVADQYEAFPYPARDPKDEAKRLITGSPSHPLEIDHFLWSGRRDWSKPFRALVAGGGTGDALIQIAQVLTSAGRPFELVYLDPSNAARAVAEARADARGLTGITFVTGDATTWDGAGKGCHSGSRGSQQRHTGLEVDVDNEKLRRHRLWPPDGHQGRQPNMGCRDCSP